LSKSILVKALFLLVVFSVSSLLPAISKAQPQENTWKTLSPMPQSISGARAAVVNGKIYVMSGTFNYEYDPITGDWTAKKPMPTARNFFGMAVCENKIYTIGGGVWDSDIGYVMSNANEVYNPVTDSWESKTAMLTGRMSLSASEVEGKIYLIAGRTGGPYSTVALNEVYDVTNDSWTVKKPSLYPVVDYASAVVDGKIFVMGGQDEFFESANVGFNQIYDPVTDSWSLGTSLPEIVWKAAAGATTGEFAPKRIYVVGGTPDMGAINLTQVYDPKDDLWTLGAQMPTARNSLAVAVVDDLLYAIGGSPHPWDSFMTSEQYTPFGYEAVQPSSTPEPQSDSFPTTLVLVSAFTVTTLGIGLLFYFKKRHAKSGSEA
jgi:N-acetylneuraminic acid mutarotase